MNSHGELVSRESVGKHTVIKDRKIFGNFARPTIIPSKGYYSLILPALQRISQHSFIYMQGYCQDQPTFKHTVPKHFKINSNPAELMQDECFYSRMSRIQILVKCNNSLH